MKVTNLRIEGRTLNLQINTDGTLSYAIDKFSPKTLARKKYATTSIDTYLKKPVKGIHKTASELIIDYVFGDDEIHVCHDDKSVCVYSKRRSLDKYEEPYTPCILTSRLFDEITEL